MTDLRDPNTRTWTPLTLRIDRVIHADLKILARRDRRSTQNLVNKVLAEWVAEMKNKSEEWDSGYPYRTVTIKGGKEDE